MSAAHTLEGSGDSDISKHLEIHRVLRRPATGDGSPIDGSQPIARISHCTRSRLTRIPHLPKQAFIFFPRSTATVVDPGLSSAHWRTRTRPDTAGASSAAVGLDSWTSAPRHPLHPLCFLPLPKTREVPSRRAFFKP